jgi:hypothetical protein
LDCELGLVDACATDTLADIDGVLRTEYPDECEAASATSEDIDDEGGDSESVSDVDGGGEPSESEEILGSLPYYDCFADGGPLWDATSGSYSLVDDESPDSICNLDAYSESASYFPDSSFESSSVAQRNVTLWNGFDDTTLDRRFTVDFKMLSTTSKRNAGVIVNYRDHPTIPGRYQYFLVELDYNEQELRIKRWTGSSFITEPAFVSTLGLSPDLWYRLSIEVTPGAGSTTDITATLDNVDAPALNVTLGPFNTSRLLPGDGLFGLHANRSYTRFNSVRLEDIS